MIILTYVCFVPLCIVLLYVSWSEKFKSMLLKNNIVYRVDSGLSQMGKWYWVAFGLCMAAGIFVRVYRFCELPKGVNQDGGRGALEAFLLLNNGVDSFGRSWPTYFEAWKYTNMSTLYSWMMIPFVKIYGNTVFAMRLPSLLISVLMLPVMWDLGKRMKGRYFGLLLLFLTATNPWQILQSRWGIDANIMPHIFVIAFCFLYIGIDKKIFLLISMVLFGLTVYAYGLAAFLVPAFLVPTAVYLTARKKVNIPTLAICVCIFTAVAGMYYWTLAINAFGLETVKIGPITLPYLEYSHRASEIALAQHDGILAMADDLWGVFEIFFEVNFNNAPYDVIEWSDAMYRFMPVFYVFGFVWIWKMRRQDVRNGKDTRRRTYSVFMMTYLLAALFTGLQTGMTVMRFNYLFYAVILLSGYCIYEMGKRFRSAATIVIVLITLNFTVFCVDYYTNKDYQNRVGVSFRSGLFTALKDTRDWDYDQYVIGVKHDVERKEIEPTVQYAHEIDYDAITEKSDLIAANGERTDWYYTERYVFITNPDEFKPNPMDCSVYIMRKADYSDKFTEEDYLITDYDQFIVAYPRYWAE